MRWKPVGAAAFKNIDGHHGDQEKGADYTITGLTGGVAYEVQVGLEVNSKTINGYVHPIFEYSASVVATPKPNAGLLPPRNLKVANYLEPGRARVTWDAPDGASPIDYVVRYFMPLGKGGSWSQTRQHPVDGLREFDGEREFILVYSGDGLAYQLKIAAVYPSGMSAFTPILTAVSKVGVLPSKPTRLWVEKREWEEHVRLAWQPPFRSKHYAHAVTGYKVRWKPHGRAAYEPEITVAATTETTRAGDYIHAISGLVDDNAYTLQVAAENAFGTGDYAEVSYRPVAPPRILRASIFNTPKDEYGAYLGVVWEAPPLAEDEQEPYVVRWKPSTAATFSANARSRLLDFSPTPFAQLSIADGTLTYDVQIAAQTWKNGAYITSAHASATAYPTEREAPDTPQGVTVTPGDGALDIAWQKGKPGLTYGVSWVLRPNWAWEAKESGIAETSGSAYTITGLTNGNNYRVTVWAFDPLTRRYSKSVKELGTPSLIGTPHNPKLTAGIYSIKVEWGSSSAVAAHTYNLRWKKADANDFNTVMVTGGVHTINDLQENTVYKVQISDSAEKQATTKEVVFTLDSNEDGTVNAADGILLWRYLLGVRGKALVAGQAHVSHATVEKILKLGVDGDKVLIVYRDGTYKDGTQEWTNGYQMAKFLITGKFTD
ncbi:MAG: fibronectin type III domain-containing protein [Gammaproteobacteria bacterium]|nr:fibronectin type III domain-containing protein [Gammaproteobacteria bacterium]